MGSGRTLRSEMLVRLGRTVPALGLAMALGALSPSTTVLALGNGGGGASSPPPDVQAQYHYQVINPNTEGVDVTLRTYTPYARIDRRVGTQQGAPPPTRTGRAQPGQDCSFNWKTQIEVSEAKGDPVLGYRDAKWQSPKQAFTLFDPAKLDLSTWYFVDPNAQFGRAHGQIDPRIQENHLVINPDGSKDGTPSGSESAVWMAKALGAHTLWVSYRLAAKVAITADGFSTVCVINSYDWLTTETYNPTMDHGCPLSLGQFPCTTPLIDALNPPAGECQANCAQPVDQVITRDRADQALAHVIHDGGAITTNGPNPQRLLVNTPLTLGLTGGPASQKDVYVSVTIPVGNTFVVPVTYQLRLSYVGTDWNLHDDDTGTDRVLCLDVIQCQVSLDTASHYHLSAVDHFAVSYRWMYYTDYQGGQFQYKDWAPFPGMTTRELCAQPATQPPPSCGPGLALTVLQQEAIPVAPPG